MINAFRSINSSNIPEFGTLLLVRELRIPYIWYMSTAELKLHLHEMIDGITDDSVLQVVHTLLSNSSKEDWSEALPASVLEELILSIEEAKNNEAATSNEEMLADARKEFPHLNL